MADEGGSGEADTDRRKSSTLGGCRVRSTQQEKMVSEREWLGGIVWSTEQDRSSEGNSAEEVCEMGDSGHSESMKLSLRAPTDRD